MNKKVSRKQFLQSSVGAGVGLGLTLSAYSLENCGEANGFKSGGSETKKIMQTNQNLAGAQLQRKIPGSGELIPALGLGTWAAFNEGRSKAEKRRLSEVLDTFYDRGGRLIDSSPMYGRAESVVGELLADNASKDFFYATKVWTSGKDAGIHQMQNSLSKMRVKTMDLMQIHNLVDWRTHMKTLRDWKEKGLIRYIGVTHYVTSAFESMEKILKSEPIDFVQIPYSVVLTEAEKRILPLCREKKVATLINRPFEGGDLFRRVRSSPLPDFAAEIDANSWAQIFLKFILSHPDVTCAIPGAGNPAHLRDNMGAGQGKLPDEVFRKKIRDYFARI